MATFADRMDSMDAKIMSSLNDGRGDYLDASGRCCARGIELIVDHNLERVGPDGAVFQTNAVGITFQRAALNKIDRGGVFQHNSKRYVVEDEISNDGQWITAACMELK